MFETNSRDVHRLDRLLHGERPLIMGVLNVTPDSFSDGGRFAAVERAVAHAERMMSLGADIVDVGGESTRPGAAPVSVDEELARVIPVIEKLAATQQVLISVDTSKAEVMKAAADAGADMINDVWALRQPGALEAAASTGLPVCLMHMQGEPGTMQERPSYDAVVEDVMAFLEARAAACVDAGIQPRNIVLDPGFGFGKRLDDNLALLRALGTLVDLGYPVLAGMSRKSMIGEITGKAVDQRLIGSVTLATLAVQYGARIVRVHDVAETQEALAILTHGWPPTNENKS